MTNTYLDSLADELSYFIVELDSDIVGDPSLLSEKLLLFLKQYYEKE